MDCLKCAHYMKDRDACIACVTKNPEIPLTNKGQDFVAYDEVIGTSFEPKFDPTAEMLAEIDEREGQAEAGTAIGSLVVPTEVAVALSEFLRQIFMLSLRELDVLRRKFQSLRTVDGRPTDKEIGDEIGISKQEVREVMHSVISKCPAVAAMFPAMKVTLRKAHADRLEKGLRPDDYAGYRDGVKMGKAEFKRRRKAEAKRKREEAKRKAKQREAEERERRLAGLSPDERAWMERAERRAKRHPGNGKRANRQAPKQEAPLLI